MDAGYPTVPPLRDLWTLYASAPDKVVSVGAVLARAVAEHPEDFWRGRQNDHLRELALRDEQAG